MELIATATIWSMFACFLVFPKFGLPPLLHRTAMTLLSAELLALALVSYGSGATEQAGRAAATYDIPLLALGLVALAIIRAVRRGVRS